jgi:hypothetical protein
MLYPPISSEPVPRLYGVFLIRQARFFGPASDLHLTFSGKIKIGKRKKVSKSAGFIPVFVKFSRKQKKRRFPDACLHEISCVTHDSLNN